MGDLGRVWMRVKDEFRHHPLWFNHHHRYVHSRRSERDKGDNDGDRASFARGRGGGSERNIYRVRRVKQS